MATLMQTRVSEPSQLIYISVRKYILIIFNTKKTNAFFADFTRLDACVPIWSHTISQND